MSPSPNLVHQQISARVQQALMNHLDAHPDGWCVAAPSDVQLTDEDVYEPDVYFVSRGRAHILTEQGAFGAPDLVVEILSPSTAKLDLGPKKDAYTAAGVRELWIIHPGDRRLDAYDLAAGKGEPPRAFHPGETLATALLPGLRLEIARLFA